MSLLKVGRYNRKPDWTISRLYINNIHDGYAVEDEIRDVKVHGETAIPYGTYKLGHRQSPKFSKSFLYCEKENILIEPKDQARYSHELVFVPHELIWVMDIPGFEYVLIHWGNTDDDSSGCLIIGASLGVIGGQEGVVRSRDYYKMLYPKIYPLIRAGGQFIEYVKE
jgi:hypothetical protein